VFVFICQGLFSGCFSGQNQPAEATIWEGNVIATVALQPWHVIASRLKGMSPGWQDLLGRDDNG